MEEKSFYEEERTTEEQGDGEPEEGVYEFVPKGEEKKEKKPPKKGDATLAIAAIALSLFSFLCFGMPAAVAGFILALVDRHRRGKSDLGTLAIILSVIAMVYGAVSLVIGVVAFLASLIELAGEGGGLPPYGMM